MSKLSEIRNKLQQAQQAKSNAEAQLDPKAKAKRLKRLKELLARLKKGEDITRRDLKGVLTDEQWQDFENNNEYLKVDYTQVLERPDELNMYLDKEPRILQLAERAGFLMAGKWNLGGSVYRDQHQYLYLLERTL